MKMKHNVTYRVSMDELFDAWIEAYRDSLPDGDNEIDMTFKPYPFARGEDKVRCFVTVSPR